MQSGDDKHFASAFWELYLHETYHRGEWIIEIEPQVPNATTRPDFLVSKDDVTYYVEARFLFEGGDDSEAARLNKVLDTINHIDSGPYFLCISILKIGSGTPPTGNMKKELESWCACLDPEVMRTGGDQLIHEWRCGDWDIVFRPIYGARQSGERTVVGYGYGYGSPDVDTRRLLAALEDKGSKYGNLPYPLMIAVDLSASFLPDDCAAQALFGTAADSCLTQRGYWGRQGQPEHRNTAGILVASGLAYHNVTEVVPTFWKNAYAARAIEPQPSWRVAHLDGNVVQYGEPRTALDRYFGLPNDWLVEYPFL